MEYAIRAGSSTPYPWGSAAEDVCQYGNVRDVTANARFPQWKTGVACNDGALFTSAVGRYRGNAFGLFDTVGNVEVWTQDCGVENYDSAPSDGSVQRSPSCEQHTLRGSSWNFPPLASALPIVRILQQRVAASIQACEWPRISHDISNDQGEDRAAIGRSIGADSRLLMEVLPAPTVESDFHQGRSRTDIVANEHGQIVVLLRRPVAD
jgi:hypothetical protein